MNKALAQFQRFFGDSKSGGGAGSAGAADAASTDAASTHADNAEVHRVPPRMEPADALRARSSRYLGLLMARDIQGLIDAIVMDLDKEQILKEVADLRRKHPRMSDAQLADVLIKSASNAMSVAAVASGLAWAVPAVGIATGSLATAAEVVAMIVYQSRLVVSVAAVYGHDIRSAERGRDVVVCIASATAGGAVQLGVRAAVQLLVERITAMLARRTAAAVVKSVPIAGAVAGLAGGAAAAVFNRLAVRAVGRYAVRFYGAPPPISPTVKSPDMIRS